MADRASEDGLGFAHVDGEAAAADARGQAEEGRKEELRAAILGVLPADHPAGLTREEIWQALPPPVRVNDKRFQSVLEAGVGDVWRKEGDGGRDGYRYRRTAPANSAEHEGGKE